MDNFTSVLQQHERVLLVYERKLPEKDPYRITAMGEKTGAFRMIGEGVESLALY